MPSFLCVIKDTSPLLVYSQEWRPGTSETDSSLDQYTLNTFTLTQAQGATMKFNFFGSYVGVFGARRSNHGNYMVQMDGDLSPTFNGESANSEFNQTLYSTDVNLGFHNMTVINGGNTFFDIDYVAFETSIGQDDEVLIVNTYKDTHPSFVYTPSSAWTIPNRVGTFLGGTGHDTTICQGSVNFPSDAVALYGPVGPNSTQAYSVQVDNGSPVFLNANKPSYRPQEVLFYTGHLGGGQHTLQVQLPATTNGEFAIDYATVYTTPSLGGSFLNASQSVNSSSSHSSLPAGTAAALAITATLAALASLLCMYLFWRHRFEILRYSPPSPKEPMSILPIDDETERPYPYVLSSRGVESSSRQNLSSNGQSFGHSRTVSNAASQSLSAISGPNSVGTNSAGENYAPPAPVRFQYGYARNEKSRILSTQQVVEQPYEGQSTPNNGRFSDGHVPPPSYS